MTILKEDIQKIVQNDILPGMTWQDPTGGGTQERIDQLTSRIPFRSISSSFLDVPMLTGDSELVGTVDMFINDTGTSFSLPSATPGMTSTSFEMKPAGAVLSVPSSGVGTALGPARLEEYKRILASMLKRFLSTAVVYGQYASNFWVYDAGWDQSLSFAGLHQLASTYGYVHAASTSLTLANLNRFIRDFRSANQGKIDYLVMNRELREMYLNLWHGSNQVPQYVVDPMTGEQCLAHDGVPILLNDYILTCDTSNDPDHPENYAATTIAQTSMYAVVLGEEKQGLFGIYPESFGESPLRVEEAKMSEQEDALFFRGMVEAGLAVKTERAIGRWAGIEVV